VALALVAAVVSQEVVFRFAIPFFIALFLVSRGAYWRDGLFVGLGVSTALFLVAPGEFSELRAGGVFIAMSVLLAHAVWSGKTLIAPIAAHALYSFLTVSVVHVDLSTSARLSFTAASLFLLATLGLEGKVRVIDIREVELGAEVQADQGILRNVSTKAKVLS